MTRPATPGADEPQATFDSPAGLADLLTRSIDADIEEILYTGAMTPERLEETTPSAELWWRSAMVPEPLTIERVQEGMRRAMETCGRGANPAPVSVRVSDHHYDALRFMLTTYPRVNFGAFIEGLDFTHDPPRRNRAPREGERVYTSRPRRGQRSLFDE